MTLSFYYLPKGSDLPARADASSPSFSPEGIGYYTVTKQQIWLCLPSICLFFNEIYIFHQNFYPS